ncbi:hypothetical protein [Kiloniella majae]|uniref:hypothetical protein n=1 Tax=Kiloniella majae TaxID=1938558 RepID=UPI000A278EB8|nr:hypothetical protein [Kiloniella majae]
MSFKNLISRIHNKLAIEADAFLWHWSVRHLRQEKLPDIVGTVFICDLMAMIATAKIEALYANKLRNQGYRPVVLLPDRAPFIEKLYRSTCPDVEFVYLTKLKHNIDSQGILHKATRILDGLKSSSDILSLTYKQCRIGKNALSYAVRKLRVGTLDLHDDNHRQHFKNTLIEALHSAEAANSFIKELSPDIALFNERGYSPAGEFFDSCLLAGIRTIQWLGAPQKDKLLFKGYNINNQSTHPLALSDKTWERLSKDPAWTDQDGEVVIQKLKSHYDTGAWFNRQKLQSGKSIIPSSEIIQSFGLDPKKKTAVIFSHIFYDATFFYGESLYPDYKQWLIETIRLAIQNQSLNWIVKVHPVNVWRSEMDGVAMEQLEKNALYEEFGELPEHIRIMPADTDINTFSLFQLADYGLTVRGTIGMEFPCFGIPIVTAGTGRYSGRGFTVDPSTKKDYKTIIQNLHKTPKLTEKTVDLARRYAYGTFFLRPFPMTSYTLDFDADTFLSKALKQNTIIKKQVNADESTLSDLDFISNWIIETNEEDLINKVA